MLRKGDFMESIVSLIIFVFPGIFITLLYKEYLPTSKNEPSDYEKAVIAFIYSFAVLVLNILIMKYVFSINITVVSEIIGKFENIGFFLKYVFLTFANSLIFAVGWYYVSKYIVLGTYNIFRFRKKLPLKTRYSTVWDEIFENPDIDMNDAYVVIEKDGVLITQGLIALYSPIESKEKELKLICTDAFKNYLENDKNLPEEEKIFNDIEFEYFNLEKGILVKFYNNAKLKEYLSTFNNNN